MLCLSKHDSQPAERLCSATTYLRGSHSEVSCIARFLLQLSECLYRYTKHENRGKGDAYNLRLRFSEQQGYDEYFEGPRELDGGHIPAGSKKSYTFRYIAKKELPTALAKINLYAFEANGFDADPAELVVNTVEYAMPRLRVADHQFFAAEGTAITLGKNGKLTLAVQNYGSRTAKKVKLSFKLPNNVFTTDQPEMVIDSIAPGQVTTIDYGFLVNKRFDADSVAVMVNITEDTRSTRVAEAYKVKLGEYLTSSLTVNLGHEVVKKSNEPKDYTIGLQSELLENIPAGVAHPHRYALIIGNEDYSMTGANAEINVPYAVNDAVVFREYCLRTFGIPDILIKTLREAKGNISLKELFLRTQAEVKKATAMIGKMQEPQFIASPTWKDWEGIKLNR